MPASGELERERNKTQNTNKNGVGRRREEHITGMAVEKENKEENL